MARFFLQDEQLQEREIGITGDEAHHIARVLRLRQGDIIECVCGEQLYAVQLTAVTGTFVSGRVLRKIEAEQESPLRLTLFQGLAKGNKMDFVVQKAVELGVAEIVPFLSRYTVVKINANQGDNRLKRWQRIAKEAAQQCLRQRLPKIHPIQDFSAVLALLRSRLAQEELVLVPFEKEQKTGLQKLEIAAPEKISVIIGPEGGFHQEEVAQLEELGARAITLGPRILRTETAGLVALSLLGYKWGDLG